MVGDINIFLHPYLEENEAEINIMIGDSKFRNQGIASAALKIMMDFAYQQYKRTDFIAKIKSDNVASINLFKKLGFTFLKNVECFEETHFVRKYISNDNNLIY